MSTYSMLSNGAPPPDEQIDVLRVRLSHCDRSAVVSELYAADMLLATWATDLDKTRTLDFEVTFADGYTFCGSYEHGRYRKTRRPSLSRFVRLIFKSLMQTPPSWPEGVAFVTKPTAEFSRYFVGSAS
jgi:hypothetical protein